MIAELDLGLEDRRTVHAYDTGPSADNELTVYWHHGTPQLGAPPPPLVEAGGRRVRWVAHDRPGYGRSPRRPGRTVASVTDDVTAVVDAVGVDRFAVLGHSGGGPHALACAGRLVGRVTGVACLASLAPADADGLAWYAGMAASGEAELRAAVDGPAALEAHLAASDFDEEQLTPSDHDALAGAWSYLGDSADQAMADGRGGMVDDDLAYVASWGFDLSDVHAPVLLVHGEADRIVPISHSRWLVDRCRSAELWLRPGDGHLSVLDSGSDALAWLLAGGGATAARGSGEA